MEHKHASLDKGADKGADTITDKIEPGMAVFGVDGEKLGAVESVGQDGIGLLTHTVPSAAIARVDDAGVHLLIAHAAFAASSPETREDAPEAGNRGA